VERRADVSKRILLILLPVFLAFSLVFGIYQFIKPRAQVWILSQINRLSAEKLPVYVQIQQVDWSLLFPEIELSGLEVSSKEIKIPRIQVKKVTASLDLLALATGRIAISTLLFEKPVATVNLDDYIKNSSETDLKSPLPLADFFSLLKKTPVSRVGIHEAEIHLDSKRLKTSLTLGAADLLLINRKDRISLQIDFNDSTVDYQQSGVVPFRLQGEAVMNSATLDVSNLKLGVLNSVLTAKGSFTDLPRVLIQPKGTVEFEAFSELDQISETARNLFHLPDISGKMTASGRMEIASASQVTAGFKFSGQQLKISHYDIGDIQFNGNLQDEVLKIPTIALTNEAGLVDVKSLELALPKKENGNSFQVRADISSDQVDINELLQRIGLDDLPLEIFVGAQLKCAGPIYPQLEFRCQGTAKGEQLEVRTGRKYEETLVLVDEFSTNGEFTVSNHDVRYKSTIQAGKDQGASDGVIDYKSGFKINYSSPEFHFSNLRRLAGFKLEGATALKGSTQGTSQSATFSIDLQTKDFVFEDFKLGSPSGLLNYEKGFLHFSQLSGSFPNSQYSGNLDVNLNQKNLKAQGQFSKFELPELLSVFERKFKMPVEFTGTGKADFQVEGPFSLGQLSFNLNASVQRGAIVGETFDHLDLAIHSISGEMKVDRARLVKNKTEINMTGVGHPNGQIDLQVIAAAFPLEESENIAKLGSQISGLLDVDTTLKGFILNPDVQMNGKISQLSVEDSDLADSKFHLEFFKQSFNGNLDLFDGQMMAIFQLPLNEEGPFELYLKAQDWNYTTLFALTGGGGLLNEYQAALTGELNLASEKGGIWTSSGKGTIRNLLLKRGALSLKNRVPMEMTMNSGVMALNNFRVDGDQTFFEAKGKQISKEDLNLRIDAQANLRLFQIFLPFLEELGGQVNIGADVSGPLLKPEILGTANIRSAFAKIKGFPHPFEKTQGEIQFSQSKILITGFLGNIAGGTFEGDGSILIEGPKNLPTRIRAHLDSVNFNVPDRVRTSGDAEVVFSGNWFPFTLSGTYHVLNGFMDKELPEETSSGNLKQSSYLPKMILQSAFEPIYLDLNVILEKPLIVKNSLIDGSVIGSIQVKGTPSQIELGGQLIAEKGSKATFRDKVFEIQSAIVRFNSPGDINPELYVTARSRISEYDVSMLIQGNAKNPVVKLSSVPPLSDQDIVSLIALGVTSQSLDKQSLGARENKDSAAGGVMAGIFSQIEPVRKLQKSTGVQIQVSNSYDDTRNLSVQRVTISKKLSEKVKAAASQMSSKASQSNEYTLQYSITDNISAIGRYEDRKPNENSSSFETTNRENQSILGLDLEFKKEFK
jgi:translocation and assembly module TamB